MFATMPSLALFWLLLSDYILAQEQQYPFSHSNDHNTYDECFNPRPRTTLTDRLNLAMNSSGPGYILSLCPRTNYIIDAPIKFAAPNQEISTLGYPTDETRAMIVVNGPVVDGEGMTTAVDGTCRGCDGVRLLNVQIDGMRRLAPRIRAPSAGGTIEMGGPNSNQLISHVRSFDPRGWSCLHVAEGPNRLCRNVTVSHNDIGPCGANATDEWADGISFSCADGTVRMNRVFNPTDGGIVLFGSPGTLVENNTIMVQEQTLLGGINLVDYLPWQGNYTNTVVRNNTIIGAYPYAPNTTALRKRTSLVDDIIIKIGIAIGPRIWFGDEFGSNTSWGGAVYDNQLMGAFGYGLAVSSAANFSVLGNTVLPSSVFGADLWECEGEGEGEGAGEKPDPAPFVAEWRTLEGGVVLQSEFGRRPGAGSGGDDGAVDEDEEGEVDLDHLICIQPPGFLEEGLEWMPPQPVSPRPAAIERRRDSPPESATRTGRKSPARILRLAQAGGSGSVRP